MAAGSVAIAVQRGIQLAAALAPTAATVLDERRESDHGLAGCSQRHFIRPVAACHVGSGLPSVSPFHLRLLRERPGDYHSGHARQVNVPASTQTARDSLLTWSKVADGVK